jgi:peptidoglycan hydrolase-like protein with peptidoglycan-binding domain
MRATSRSSRRLMTRFTARSVLAVLATVATLASTLVVASPADAANRVTPGSFTGHGFDQCTAPTQKAMDAWLTASPYWAVGIYISGDSRGCLSQPNLTPTWVTTQLAKGWRLLPITLGPQAWCTTRERYLRQVRINPSSSGSYATARQQGSAEASKTVAAAQKLGISAGSTLWYDIEAFSIAKTDCRESALSFLSAWTDRLHALGYVSGIYSSGASGIKMLDDARATRPGLYTMPDQLWIADWNGRADTYSSYVRSDGWMPRKRMHQYRGGHNETYGGVTINIDNNWLDLGRGSTPDKEPVHCGGVAYSFTTYYSRRTGNTGALVKAAQCLLTGQKMYAGKVDGVYGATLATAARRYRAAHGLPAAGTIGPRVWVSLLSQGSEPVLKVGSANDAVRRVQRSLNAADRAGLTVTGSFDARTTAAVRRYQADHGLSQTGVVTTALWAKLQSGLR